MGKRGPQPPRPASAGAAPGPAPGHEASQTARFAKPAILAELTPGRHTVIAASAGTGKTYTIEHLVVELLLGGAGIDQILTVTFTEKAAAELASRVRGILERLLSGDAPRAAPGEPAWEIGPAERRCLEHALFNFDQAAIHTIHGFCQRVLTEHAFGHGRLLQQQLVDGRAAFHRALRATLRSRLGDDRDCQAALLAWLAHSDLEALEDLLWVCQRERGPFHPPHDAAWLADQARALGDLLGPRPSRAVLEAGYAAAVDGRSRRAALASLERLAAAGADPWRLLDRDLLHDAARLAAPRLRAGAALEGPAAALAARCAELTGRHPTLEAAVVQVLLPLVDATLAADKAATGAFDFDDLLRLVAEGLRGPGGPALAAELRRRYRHAIIDEFQDTDDRQWSIFAALFAAPEAKSTLYVVGDPKQAIYGFRGADVHTYLRAVAELAASGGRTVRLGVSYRASAELLDAVQRVLADEHGALLRGAIGYDQPVACGDPQGRLERAAPATPITLLRVESGEREVAAGLRRRLGQGLARALADLLASEAQVVRAGQRRPLRPEDVFVLTFTNEECLETARHLRAAGVACAIYKQAGLLASAEACGWLEALRGVQDWRGPGRVAALLSPFFDLPLATAAAALPDEHPALQRLAAWHELARQRRWARLFAAMLDESGLLRRLLLFDPGRRALTNYQHLGELLLAEALATRGALPDLLATLERWIAGLARPAGVEPELQRLEVDAGAVQIMTIHRSKGLEAEVVAVTGGLFSGATRATALRFHRGHQRLVQLGPPGDPAVAEAIRGEQLEEQQRLLYVAVTRARGLLYLPWICGSQAALDGPYAQLNARLTELMASQVRPAGLRVSEPLERGAQASTATRQADLLAWRPEPPVAWPLSGHQQLAAAAARARGPIVTSYSRLKRSAGEQYHAPLDTDDPAGLPGDDSPAAGHDPVWPDADDRGLPALPAVSALPISPPPPPDSRAVPGQLPGGTAFGILVHALLERVPPATLAAPTPDAWARNPQVEALLDDGLRRAGLRCERRALADLLFRSLNTPLDLPGGPLPGLGHAAPAVSELEFHFPWPEPDDPPLGAPLGPRPGPRGLVKGFIDLLFEHQGLTYALDWKTDQLPAYEAALLGGHVAANYQLQARLYSLAVARLLGLRGEEDCRQRFGGLLYVFVRGLADPLGKRDADKLVEAPAAPVPGATGPGGAWLGPGLWWIRPRFAELEAWEQELRQRGPS